MFSKAPKLRYINHFFLAFLFFQTTQAQTEYDLYLPWLKTEKFEGVKDGAYYC